MSEQSQPVNNCYANILSSENVAEVSQTSLINRFIKHRLAVIWQELTLGLAVFRVKATNPVAVVADLDNRLVLSQVPHNCFPAGVGRGQDVLNLSVPGHDADVFSRLKEETKGVTVKANLNIQMRNTVEPCKHSWKLFK